MGRGERQPGNFTAVFGEKRGLVSVTAEAKSPVYDVSEDNPATLIINRSSSKCSVCGKGADPNDKQHIKVLGYGDNLGEGCGVTWTHVRTDYVGPHVEEATREMRPDLIFVGPKYPL